MKNKASTSDVTSTGDDNPNDVYIKSKIELTNSTVPVNKHNIINIKHIPYLLDKYEIDVIVDDNDRFIGIGGIMISKDYYLTKISAHNMRLNNLINKMLHEDDEANDDE